MGKINISGTRVVDLSQGFEPDIPTWPGFPAPKVEMMKSQEKGDSFNAELVTYCPHTGTHMDAPWHFIPDGQKLDQLPPDCLIGPAIVICLPGKKGNVPITAEDLKAWEKENNENITEGDAVLIGTGHDKYWKPGKEGDDFWKNGWPYVTKDAAEYLVSKKIRLIGMEPMAIDSPEAADNPAHITLLSNGILILENLTRLDQIGAKRCSIIATPLKFKGSGTPVRVLAVL